MTNATVADAATATTPSTPSNPFTAEAASFVARLRALDCKPSQIQFEIDGLMYTSTKLSASVGLDVLPRIAALLGPALARALSTGDGFDIDAGLLASVADRAMRDGLIPLLVSLLGRTQCNHLGGALTAPGGFVLSSFDTHFAGEYGHLLKVCAFVLSHNFRGPTYGVR